MPSLAFRALLIIATLAIAACSNATPVADGPRYRDIEFHVGAYDPVQPGTPHTPVPGERAWTTSDDRTVHLVHALTIPGAEIQSLSVNSDATPTVDVALTSDGSAGLRDLTEANVGKVLGIVIGEHLVSAPTIGAPVGQRFQVQTASAQQAQAMVDTLTNTPVE
ncbi:SecDF P1 head subdomain-containing protein [Luteimonas terrae]|uniref:Preprotein translocase subunit SecD n=1 Tax=Luteimonas terrae TaxID=1530191 RepID=A0ABU1XYT1_9GAMM|nr:hypothetical protein [Luteimonas terrae]MDR7193922.1 preprotein translocase subunit SecD [Luteimonas terrae]